MHGHNPRHDLAWEPCLSLQHIRTLWPRLTAATVTGQAVRTAAIAAGHARPRRAARRPVLPCQQILDDLDIPEPFELTAFLARIASLRGRRIYIQPFTARHGLCGAWIRTQHADYLYHDQHTTSVHQIHILVHEIAHMLLGHEQDGGAATDLAGLLSPNPGDQHVTAMNGRCTAYTSARERDAETLASVILERSAWQASPARATPGNAGQLFRSRTAVTSSRRRQAARP